MARHNSCSSAENSALSISRKDSPPEIVSSCALCQCQRSRALLLATGGLVAFSLGFLLGVGFFSVRNVTTSVHHTEGSIPSYVTAIMLIVTGIVNIILAKKRPRWLIIVSVIACVVSTLLSFTGAVQLGTSTIPTFQSFKDCQYTSVKKECHCVYQAVDITTTYTFQNMDNCHTAQDYLKELVFGMFGLYCIAFLICGIAALIATIIICRIEILESTLTSTSRSDGDGHCNMATRQSQTSALNLSEISVAEENEELNQSVSTQTSFNMRDNAQMASSSTTSFAQHQHLVIDLPISPIPRREFCVSFNREEPPPPYSEAIIS